MVNFKCNICRIGCPYCGFVAWLCRFCLPDRKIRDFSDFFFGTFNTR